MIKQLNSPVHFPSLFSCSLRFACGWWIACNKATHVVSRIALVCGLHSGRKEPCRCGLICKKEWGLNRHERALWVWITLEE